VGSERDLKRTVANLRRDGRLPEAQALLERYLLAHHVFESDGCAFRIGSLPFAAYSYCWEVIFLDAYLRTLIEQGEGDTARRLVAESLEQGRLMDDARIVLRRRIESLEGRKHSYRFPVVRLEKAGLESRYLSLPSIEWTALACFRDELDWEGVVADVDFWRAIAAFLGGSMDEDQLSQVYSEATGECLPPSFADLLLSKASDFLSACQAPIGATAPAVGYPDLILYDHAALGSFLLVEVKDVHDRLRPHQEAVLNKLVALGLPCKLLKFV
jgi:hypothetical protein